MRDFKSFNVVDKAWGEEVKGTECFKLSRKQQATRLALKRWNKEEFGFCRARINDISNQILKVQQRECTEANLIIEANLQAELHEWLLRDEMVWKQKSRKIWLKEGDRNSKFFHLSMIIRRRRNSIDVVRNQSGLWITEKKEINEFFLENFKQVFTEEEVDFPADFENLIQPSIPNEENTEICTTTTPHEIKKAFFEMAV